MSEIKNETWDMNLRELMRQVENLDEDRDVAFRAYEKAEKEMLKARDEYAYHRDHANLTRSFAMALLKAKNAEAAEKIRAKYKQSFLKLELNYKRNASKKDTPKPVPEVAASRENSEKMLNKLENMLEGAKQLVANKNNNEATEPQEA